MRTRLKVTLVRGKSDGRPDETLLTAEHADPCRQGPTIGPFTVGDGCIYFWPGKPGCGEPIPVHEGSSLLVTVEVNDG